MSKKYGFLKFVIGAALAAGTAYVVKKAVKSDLENNDLIELKTQYNLPKLELNLVYLEDYLTNLSKYFIKNHIIKWFFLLD